MAAPAPTVPTAEAEDDPVAKRQRLATTEVAAWTPPAVTHSRTIEGLTIASFTGAAITDVWDGPDFNAVGLRWRLYVRPQFLNSLLNAPSFGLYLRPLDRTASPVEFAEATLHVRGIPAHKLNSRVYTGDPQHFRGGVQCFGWGFGWGTSWTHAHLIREADSVLAGGQMVISVTLRSRSFADLALPMRLAPLLPALIASALPSFGSELAAGVDVVFKAVGERIEAHSFILAMRSSTLRASLWGPLAASGAPSVSQPRELDIPEGIDTATFKRVLAFMYTDAVPEFETPGLSVDKVHALLHAADYLDVPGLREICVAELHKRLAPDNAVATLKLAHALSCTPLLDATLRYIAANAPAVMCAPGWAELMLEPGLLHAAMSTMATGEPPSVVSQPPVVQQPSVAPALPADKAKVVLKGKRK